MKKNHLFFLLTAFVCLSCGKPDQHTAPSGSTTVAHQVTDQEVVTGFMEKESKDLTTLIKEARIEKNRRDSVFAANREEVWVYQIGSNKKEAKDFEKTYSILSKHMQHLYFFKQSQDNYYLILHDGYNTEQELLNKQNEVEAAIKKLGVNDKVSVFNITTHCSLKEKIKPAHEVKLACKEMAVCYTCDE